MLIEYTLHTTLRYKWGTNMTKSQASFQLVESESCSQITQISSIIGTVLREYEPCKWWLNT